jgi:hypothetical protein
MSKVVYTPKPGNNEPNSAFRQTAHERFDGLLDQAEAVQLYGVVGIQAHFEAGQITHVSRKIEGSDKHG